MTLTSDRPADAGAPEPLRGRLTPELVRQSDFPRSQLGRRGYNEADVERFRNRVVLELANAAAEKAELRQEIQRLRDYYRRQGVDADRRGGRRGDADAAPSVNAVNMMSQAQQAADQHIAAAEEQAQRLVAGARAQYEKVLTEAHEQAARAAEETREAEERRSQLQSLARGPHAGTGGGRLDPQEAEKLRELSSRLAYMRTFAQVTQVQLRSILDALTSELESLTPSGST